MFFIYGHGGTRKTFLWNTLITGIRSTRKIILEMTSLGIASLLLLEGRTTHSQLKIPLNINQCSTCQIKKGTQLARLIHNTSLILWDEASMIHMHCFEAFDKSLRDVLIDESDEQIEKPFGGKTIVLRGDFK